MSTSSPPCRAVDALGDAHPAPRDAPDQVMLSSAARRALLRHARRAHPAEACGLLLGSRDSRRIECAVPCPNRADDPHRSFRIDPRTYLRVERRATDRDQVVQGFYHSHPDGGAAPSALDAEHAAVWPDTIWLIVPIHHRRAAGVAGFLSTPSPAAGTAGFRAIPVRDAGATAPPGGDP